MRRHVAVALVAAAGLFAAVFAACGNSSADGGDVATRASAAVSATAAPATEVAAATAVPTATPTSTAAPTSTVTATASPTPTPEPTATPSPTPTPAPSAVPTPAPTPAPTPVPRVEGPLTPIGDRDCGAPDDYHFTEAYDAWSGYGAGEFCIYHPLSETVVAALPDIAATTSAALDDVEATIGIAAGRTINVYAHESWVQLASMSWLPMWAAFGDTTGIWMPYTRVLHAEPVVLLHELTHTVMFRAFPGANSLLAEGVAEWAAQEISGWA
ncbi:MAG TPA: hypothetical protein QF624_08545 [Dehalococcoidia bacterium]|nr:hypothetical protein [Dehalococcoidia bacterium]